MGKFRDSLKHAWNAFTNEDNTQRIHSYDYGVQMGVRQDRLRSTIVSDRSIITSIFNRLSIDVASNSLVHIKNNGLNGRYQNDMESGLQNCLSIEANIDQAASAFKQDIAATLFNKGVIAIVPVETDVDPKVSAAYQIKTMRVGEIVGWFPQHVRINLYNDLTGKREEITMQKKDVAIIENPLFNVMNEPNGTLQRLSRKLNLLDGIDEQLGSGKLDLIIQLPYVIKNDARKAQAEERRVTIEDQLRGNKYGIAYMDGTEKITQLNRPVENNMLEQIKVLTELLYAQLGLTKGVFDGTASADEMTNYFNRTIEPILKAITEEMTRTFISKTARSQGQKITYYRDPFKSLSLTNLSNTVDVLSRNEVVTPNEFRVALGLKPVEDEAADSLRNKNLPQDQTRPDEVYPGDPNAALDQPPI